MHYNIVQITQCGYRIIAGIVLLLGMTIPAVGCGFQPSELKDKIAGITSELRKGNFQRVGVFHVPDGNTSFVTITPERLEKYSKLYVNISIEASEFKNQKETMIRALEETIFTIAKEEIRSMRWGIALFDAHEKKIVSIYLDKDYGYINDICVNMSTQLYDWFQSNFRQE
jgi:hypothetical protein